ncbi:MAG: hypothetical protein LE178_02390 [Endomicrobium sp.]|nr:hypothetical protein [Endomicrobium sp.]
MQYITSLQQGENANQNTARNRGLELQAAYTPGPVPVNNKPAFSPHTYTTDPNQYATIPNIKKKNDNFGFNDYISKLLSRK